MGLYVDQKLLEGERSDIKNTLANLNDELLDLKSKLVQLVKNINTLRVSPVVSIKEFAGIRALLDGVRLRIPELENQTQINRNQLNLVESKLRQITGHKKNRQANYGVVIYHDFSRSQSPTSHQ